MLSHISRDTACTRSESAALGAAACASGCCPGERRGDERLEAAVSSLQRRARSM
jgi:hypothetical protein